MKTHGTINKQELPEAENISVVKLAVGNEPARREKPRSDRDAYHPEQASQKKTRRFHIALVFTAMLLIAVSVGVAWFYGNIEGGSIAVDDLTSMDITLNINSQPRHIATNCATVGELLQDQKIYLTKDDYLDMDLDQKIYDGMTIWLRLAIDVTIQAGQETYTVHSQPLTVAQALETAGVVVDDDDVLEEARLSYLYKDTTISVTKMETKQVEVLEDIEPAVEKKEVANLPKGTTSVINPGEKGQKRLTYTVTYKDGQEVSRELIKEEVVKEAVAKVEGIGTGDVTAAVSTGSYGGTVISDTGAGVAVASDGSEFYYSRSFTAQATAYTATGNQTATGTWPAEGRTIAVDPSVIPLGTRVYVVGYGYAIAEDTGGAVQGNIIDLYMDSYDDCINWGRRNVTVYILD